MLADQEVAEIREDGNINLLFKELTSKMPEMKKDEDNPFMAKLKRQ